MTEGHWGQRSWLQVDNVSASKNDNYSELNINYV
jgi:hypothetical protein